jgi:hypothetical protein
MSSKKILNHPASSPSSSREILFDPLGEVPLAFSQVLDHVDPIFEGMGTLRARVDPQTTSARIPKMTMAKMVNSIRTV